MRGDVGQLQKMDVAAVVGGRPSRNFPRMCFLSKCGESSRKNFGRRVVFWFKHVVSSLSLSLSA